MTTLQISKEKAKELYPTASTEFKVLLEETFGKDFFKVSITDRVKTFDDAYGIKYGGGYIFQNTNAWIAMCTPDELAYWKLKIITAVLNEGKEGEYHPIFIMTPFKFQSSWKCQGYYFPRKLLLATKELSDYAGSQFIQLYKDYLL